MMETCALIVFYVIQFNTPSVWLRPMEYTLDKAQLVQQIFAKDHPNATIYPAIEECVSGQRPEWIGPWMDDNKG